MTRALPERTRDYVSYGFDSRNWDRFRRAPATS